MASRKANKMNVSVDEKVLSGVMTLLDAVPEWQGTMTELNTLIGRSQGRKNMPKSPSALRVVLNRVVNRIRVRGVSVKFLRAKDSSRTRYVKFVR